MTNYPIRMIADLLPQVVIAASRLSEAPVCPIPLNIRGASLSHIYLRNFICITVS
jgi:hypothetical protein